ncbi:unnamed protein product [Paramecium sonneborni]|uniref:Transmembrane protein n=1 Tax=Paramecium sonneborni TaxID=65129 RepID=A0A8S1RV08_9CILI|nr:unnamed protein product [Paramecium sonneborni]
MNNQNNQLNFSQLGLEQLNIKHLKLYQINKITHLVQMFGLLVVYFMNFFQMNIISRRKKQRSSELDFKLQIKFKLFDWESQLIINI